ncbi:hypothetical protein [Sphingomonas profundi]|uniref:hypothetical protein n=1 Tax=Alterirhizorhabdus profundi TaxID=2681549 RepID=UPI0012E90772|nr:hypothetical protein [Sphingomonas profundi]
MHETDLAYYDRRLDQETRLADSARTPEAAAVHRMLAQIYAEQVRRLRANGPRLTIVPRDEEPVRRAAA